MQQSPLTLRQRLIDAVDESYHVKDMGEIVEVLGTLEVLPVTKEMLESTRLGKTVNEFRRRTNDEQLAKRAKALVKKWRDAVLVTDPSPAALGLLPHQSIQRPLNGNDMGGIHQLPISGSLRTGYNSNSSSPKLMPSSNSSKVSPNVIHNSNSLSPRILSNLSSNNNNNNNSNNNNLSRNGQSQNRSLVVPLTLSSPGLVVSGSSSSSPSLRVSSPSQYGNTKTKSPFGPTSSPQMQLINKSLSTNSYAPNVEVVARTNAANKRLRIEDGAAGITVGPPSKKAKTIVINGGISEGTLDDPSIILDDLSKDSVTSRASDNSDGSSSKPISNISSIGAAVLSSAAPSPNSVILDSTAASPMSLGGIECSSADQALVVVGQQQDDDNKTSFPSFMDIEVKRASNDDLGANNANANNDQPLNVPELSQQPPKRGRKKKVKTFIDAETLLHQQIAQAQQESKNRTVHRLSMEVFDEEHSHPSAATSETTEHLITGRKPYTPALTTREPALIKNEIVEKYLQSQNELRTKMERQYQDAVDRNEIPLLVPEDDNNEPSPEAAAGGDELDATKKKKKKDKKKNRDASTLHPSFPTESEILSRLPPIDPQILEELKNFQFDVVLSESEEAKSKAELETEIPTSLTTTNETTTTTTTTTNDDVEKNTKGLIPSKIDWGDSDEDEDDFVEVSTTKNEIISSGLVDDVVDCDLTTTSTIPTPIPAATADQSATSSPIIIPMDISHEEEEEQQQEVEEPVLKIEIEESDVDRLHLEKVENLNGNIDKDGQFKEWHEVLGVESYKGDLLHILPYTIIDF